ncbi:MAG: helix-turn-helix domain-containing protein [Firmicutes bacterium]|nr:helix-turn-helix domain-containing protein [Bacillota bacterium]
MRKDRNWSVNRLATEAMLTQSTVANIFTKGYEPKFSTLKAICEAFGITVSDFFYDSGDKEKLSPFEKTLLAEADKLTDAEKDSLLNFLTNINAR